MICTGTRRHGNKSSRADHQNSCIIQIGQLTEKSPGDLRGLDVTQTPERNVDF